MTDYSGLEVAPTPAPAAAMYVPYAKADAANAAYAGHGPPSTPEPLILGMRKPTFFLSLALAIVVLLAAVIGGVVGSMAVKSAQTDCLANA